MTSHDLRMGEPSPISSSTRASERSVLVRVGLGAGVACGLLTTVHEVWEDSIPGIQQGAGWSLLHTSWLAAMFLALLAISAVQRSGLDRFGRICTGIALVGTGAQTVSAAVETVTLVGAPPTSGDPALPVLVVILAVIAAYVIGVILFSVATIRAGVLPRSAGVVLLAAVLLKMFVGDAVPGTLALLGLAVAWVSMAAWRVGAR